MSDELLNAQINFLSIRLEDMERLMVERLRCVRDDVDKSFESSNLALAKAEAANEVRFESVNEFRRTLSDQSQEFVRTISYNASHKAVQDKLEGITTQVTAMDAVARNSPRAISGPTFLIGVGSVIAAFVIAIVTGGIQLGALQTHVEINGGLIHQLQAFERDSSRADAQIAADVKLIKSRQEINERRLDRLEAAAESYFKNLKDRGVP